MEARDEVTIKFRGDVVSTYAVSWLLLEALSIAVAGYVAYRYERFGLTGVIWGASSAVLLGFAAYAAARHSRRFFYGPLTAAVALLLALLLTLLSRYLSGAVEAWRELMEWVLLSNFSRAARIGVRTGWVWWLTAALTLFGSFAGVRASRPREID